MTEERFVDLFIRKARRERLLHELSTPAKRRDGLGRFCHNAGELLDPAGILLEGEDLERTPAFASFAGSHEGPCLVLSPDLMPYGKTMPLNEAVALAVSCFDAVLILGDSFAVVFGEVSRGGRGKYLLAEPKCATGCSIL